MFRANNFDKLLDKATSNLRLDPDWPTILQICDLIRQNDCTPKYAVAGVKKKLYSTNPHQAMFALLTLESIVKNCGSGVHDEVTSKAFCEMLRDLVKTTQHENLKAKILELIQAWAFAFRNSPKYRAVQDTVNILKAEGYKFPVLKESDAMFSADTAPEWADGEVCHRCRTAFSLIVRRHHCRACGQVFCQQCSSKTSTLPKFGIEKEVRVCDACFDKVSRPPSSSAKLEIVDPGSDYGPAQPQKRPSTAPGGKTAEELQEEEELQLALALSQSEAEHKEKERKSRPHMAPDPTPHPTVSPTPSSVSASPEHSTQANAELSRYLDRNYWESRLTRDNAAPTAPAPASQASNDTAELQDFAKASVNKAQDDDAQDKEMDEFVETLKSQVEIFVNRMKSNSSRGRSIANDTAVQTLFMNITTMHSRLLKYIQQLDDKRVYLESLQDKVTQIRDSRAALDTLRAEHAARAAQAAEAAERQRQMQMAVKLQAMRKKKHEYLQYQRQLALQRVQEQEREMQLRQEQQKHQYMMSANSYYLPGVSMQQFQQPYPNQPIYANPQFHQMMPQTTDASVPPQPMTQPNMATIAQSMPQLPNFTMAQSTAVSQPPATQSMAQNIRPNMQMTPMMMQQLHQMRMPGQPGMHQMLPQNGQPQQNGTLPKNINQNSMPQMMGQNAPQQMMAQNMPNQMMGMHMQNVRMPMMQGNNPQIQGYMSLPNNTQAPSVPQMMPGQMSLQGPMTSMQGVPQMPGHNIPTSMPSGQLPQTQGQQMPQPGQMQQQMGQIPLQPGQMPQQGIMTQPGQLPQQAQQMPQSVQQPQMTQQMAQQPQMTQQPQMAQQLQMPQQQPQNQIAPGQQMPGQAMPPGHMMMQQPQGNMQMQQTVQSMNQGPNNPGQMMQGPMPAVQGQMQIGQPGNPAQAQAIKMQPNNFIQGQPGPPMTNQQTQQPQTPVKSEHNNNTAELISFD